MRTAFLLAMTLMLSCSIAFAQSPTEGESTPTQLGNYYAKQIIELTINEEFAAIADCCMEAFLEVEEYDKTDYDAFMASFAESAYAHCQSNRLGDDFADSLIAIFEKVMSQRGDDTSSNEEV